jgi:hypothetical protein
VELPHEKLAASLTNRADLEEARGRQQYLQQWSAMLTTNSMHYPQLFSRENQKNNRNLATIFVIREKLKNLKLQTRSDFSRNSLRFSCEYFISSGQRVFDVNTSLKSVPATPHVRQLGRHEITSKLFRKNFHDVIVRSEPV